MFKDEGWFRYLTEGQKDLADQAYRLLSKFQITNSKLQKPEFHDYSFVVFPMAKAYEGFLKKFFLDAKLIDIKTYNGDRFRIGKALNPELPEKHRGRWWLYGPLAKAGGGEALPQQLWKAWKECRNLLFHFFPKHEHFVTLDGARQRVEQLRMAMKAAVECGIISDK